VVITFTFHGPRTDFEPELVSSDTSEEAVWLALVAHGRHTCL